MIKNRLKIIVAERGISLAELSRRLDVHYTTIHRQTDESRETINVSLLNDICRELQCQPGDIYQYVE